MRRLWELLASLDVQIIPSARSFRNWRIKRAADPWHVKGTYQFGPVLIIHWN